MQPLQDQTPKKKRSKAPNSGRQLLYGEKTATVGVVVPKSKILEFFKYCDGIKKKWIKEYKERSKNQTIANN